MTTRVPTPPLLGVDEVVFSYGSREVLRGATFAVEAGELVVLVGPNGSGKSTLIRLITRLREPAGGLIRIGGEDVRQMSLPALARKVAVVPQESAPEFDFTAFEIVLMGRTPHLRGMGGETRHDLDKACEAMEMTDCAYLADRSMMELSGGERQRVVIARALAQAPELLLLDEPTSHLDINHQSDLMALTLSLCRQQQMAVLAVLHDLNLAATFADRILVLHEGRVESNGAPSEVLTKERILDVFKVETLVVPHPNSGRPMVLLNP